MKKLDEGIKECCRYIEEIKKEVGKVIIGQENMVNNCIKALLCNGHVLLEGVPGIGKTLLVKSLAAASGCVFKRIQFTIDILPTDITGIEAYDAKRGIHVIKGPIFTNFLLADEINRAPPKTQSALLEAMQEKQVTLGKIDFKIDEPFLVMATQNPIETAGVYPLPEAEIDRFLFKFIVLYPKLEEERKILKTNTSLNKFVDFKLNPVMTPDKIIKMQKITKEIFLSEDIEKYIVNIIDATRDVEKYNIKLGKYVEYGCSPRASIGLFIASKAEALMNCRKFVTPQDVKNSAYDVLRHRIILNYEGQAEGIKSDDIITEIISKVPVP